jgi:hypothetical protein
LIVYTDLVVGSDLGLELRLINWLSLATKKEALFFKELFYLSGNIKQARLLGPI